MATKKTKIEKASKKVVKEAVKKVARKPNKDEKAVEKMSLHTQRSNPKGGGKTKGANLLQGNRNPSVAREQYKRLNGKPNKAKAKK